MFFSLIHINGSKKKSNIHWPTFQHIAEETMLKKSNDMPVGAASFFQFGKEQTEATLKVQKDVLDAYDQASRAWLARVQTEVELWSQLASKLSATRSLPEALGAYQECVAQRIQMAAEDGRRLSDDCTEIMGKFTKSLSQGWQGQST
jgi:predicted phage tail protein